MNCSKIFLLPIVVFLSLVLFSCGKSDSCYDRKMEKNHSGICSADCPGVCGCDDVFYCNECEANRAGISKVTSGECD